MPTRGSRSSRCTSSESSRWITSPSFCGRPWLRTPARFTAAPGTDALQRPCDLHGFKDLELVAFLEVREVLKRHAALEARFHFAHVVLEALERVDIAGMDDHAVAKHAHLRAALDQALGNVAARHGADLRDAEDLPDLHHAEHRFLALGREHARQGCLDLVDRLV